jgi:uncharacterized membrane protein YdjX (TVP38/TMEM64 family)
VLAISPFRAALGRGASLLAAGQLAQLQQYLHSLGYGGPIVSISLMVAQALAIPVPVTITMVANGLAFGAWQGALISMVGGSTGAFAAYGMGGGSDAGSSNDWCRDPAWPGPTGSWPGTAAGRS